MEDRLENDVINLKAMIEFLEGQIITLKARVKYLEEITENEIEYFKDKEKCHILKDLQR